MVNNPSGQTIVHGGTGSTTHVVATRHFNMAGHAPDVRLTQTGSGLSLDSSTSSEQFPFGRASWVDYAIEVPGSVAVQAQSSSGQIQIEAVSGTVDLTTSSGSVRGSGLQHVRRVQSTNGSISLEGVFTEAAQVSSSNGSIGLKLMPGSAVQLDVHTNNGIIEPRGDLHLSGGVTQRDSLTGAFGTPATGATLSVQTTNGHITISQ
jgi:hypothetical protein